MRVSPFNEDGCWDWYGYNDDGAEERGNYGEYTVYMQLNPLTAKLFNLNFCPLEVVSRWRDPQLQVSEN